MRLAYSMNDSFGFMGSNYEIKKKKMRKGMNSKYQK
jgi:hypothetical protein